MFCHVGNTIGRIYAYTYAALSLFSARGPVAALRAICLAALLAGAAGAADFTWQGGVQHAVWGNADNWAGEQVPPTDGANTNVFMIGSGGTSVIASFQGFHVPWHINSSRMAAAR